MIFLEGAQFAVCPFHPVFKKIAFLYKKLNSILGETSRNMLLFGLLLSLAFIL